MNPQILMNIPGHTSEPQPHSQDSWGKMVKTMVCEGCRNLGIPIAHHPPIPALGSLSATVPLKSSAPPKASVQPQRILKGCSGPGWGAAALPACAAWPLCEPVNKGQGAINPMQARELGAHSALHTWNCPWHTQLPTPDPIQCPEGSAVGC